MKRLSVGLLAIVAAAVFTVSAESQPPEGKDGKDRPRGGDRRGPGGPGGPGGPQGGPGRFELGRVLPPPMRDDLHLSEEQAKMIDDLEKDVKERLSKILTADQKKKLESFRPRGPGGPGGPGGPPPGDRRPRDRGRPPEGRGRPDGDRPGRDNPPPPPGRGGDGPGRPRREPPPDRPRRDDTPPPADDQAKADAGIQWFATWSAGKAEAVRTGRPILLVSAAPHCAGVSGIW